MTLDEFRAATSDLPGSTEIRSAPAAWCRGSGTTSIAMYSVARILRPYPAPALPEVFDCSSDMEKWGFGPDEWDNADRVLLLFGDYVHAD